MNNLQLNFVATSARLRGRTFWFLGDVHWWDAKGQSSWWRDYLVRVYIDDAFGVDDRSVRWNNLATGRHDSLDESHRVVVQHEGGGGTLHRPLHSGKW